MKSDIEKRFRKCFLTDQLKKITRSKYNKLARYAVVEEEQCDNIIRAAEEAGVNTTLGLSQQAIQERHQNREYNASAITYGEVREGAMDAHNFTDELSLTTTKTNKNTGAQLADGKHTLAQSVYSVETREQLGSDKESEGEGNTEGEFRFDGIEIVGQMELENTAGRPDADRSSGSSKSREAEEHICDRTKKLQVKDVGDKSRVTNTGSRATEASWQGNKVLVEQQPSGQGKGSTTRDSSGRKRLKNAEEEEDGDEEHIDIMSFDEKGSDYHTGEEETLSSEGMEVDSNVSDATNIQQALRREELEPTTFLAQLWNDHGPNIEVMIQNLDGLDSELQDDEKDLPANYDHFSNNLLGLLQNEAGQEFGSMQNYIRKAKEKLYQMWEGEEELHWTKEEEDGDGHEGASKTQDNLPRARTISHAERAIQGRDKEGKDHLSMANND